MKRVSLLLIWTLLLPCFAAAQEYSYTRYDVQNGLAGSTVYCMLQDREGFLWFGTETGVSRFDGTHFKNFTTYNGLTDNQIIEIFEDSKGRIWMSPFNKSVCYYYKGRIYNSQNDTLLRKFAPTGFAVNFAEDSRGNVLVQQRRNMHIIKPSGEVVLINSNPLSDTSFICSGTGDDGNFQVLYRNNIETIVNDTLKFRESITFPFYNYRSALMEKGVFVYRNGLREFTHRYKGVETHLKSELDAAYKFSIINDSMVTVNSPTGAWMHYVRSGRQETFLPNEAISTVLQDKEGNLWFCTLGHGIFMLNSKYILNFSLRNEKGAKLGAYFLTPYRDGWLVGSDMIKMFHVTRTSVKQAFAFLEFMPERIIAIEFDDAGHAWAGTDARIMHLKDDLTPINRYKFLHSVKSCHRVGRSLYVASATGVFLLDMPSATIVDTFWSDRATTTFASGDKVYAGTLDGLFIVDRKKNITDVGKDFPQLRNRIMDIRQSADGTLWIATFSGIFAFRDGKIISSITEQQGLVSNICRTINIYKNEMWVGTNKGLQKFDIADPLQPKPEYVLSTELSSNIINYIVADSTSVVVATAEGVNIIDKTKITFSYFTNLRLDDIIVSGKEVPWEGRPLYLSKKDNNIRFEFAGISFTSGGDMRYEYRLLGLDSTWKRTRDNFLNYPTLPGGNYQLQLVAINKFGLRSEPMSIDFTIEKRLYQKAWFQILSGLVLLLLVWLILSWRIRVIRRQEEEKASVRKKMADLEQLALKSQMNPHFIFNSLNSIQHYVFDKDIPGANRFITGFSRLIRQTLDISSKHVITLAEEINYLSTYLFLEKMRFEDKFSFEIKTDPGLQPDETFIPPLILQPFVENCVRHGIRYREDNNGKILIEFRRSGDYMLCIIEDNGIGRKMALQHKSNNPIEYQSKGISLTADRIELMNRNATRPIKIDFHDLEDGQGSGTGTKVIINFPLQPN